MPASLVLRGGTVFDGTGAPGVRADVALDGSGASDTLEGSRPRCPARRSRCAPGDEELVPFEEAVRRMTSLPADTLRLVDRGRLVAGAFADVVVLDPALVADRATYEDAHRYAVGIRHVLVNGELVVAAGSVTAARPGRRLRRGA